MEVLKDYSFKVKKELIENNKLFGENVKLIKLVIEPPKEYFDLLKQWCAGNKTKKEPMCFSSIGISTKIGSKSYVGEEFNRALIRKVLNNNLTREHKMFLNIDFIKKEKMVFYCIDIVSVETLVRLLKGFVSQLVKTHLKELKTITEELGEDIKDIESAIKRVEEI